MKYRTLIELICEASDREDASNIAGDYLKGDVDFGVEMRCKTVSLWEHRVKKYAVSCTVAVLVLVSFLLKVAPTGLQAEKESSAVIGFSNTYTILPALKTKHKDEFKSDWEKKKNEAVFEYLKK